MREGGLARPACHSQTQRYDMQELRHTAVDVTRLIK